MALLESIWSDLRIAVRVLRKSPGATALSVISIALGIGLTAGMFSVGDAMVLRPLTVSKPGELRIAASMGDDGNHFLYGWPDYLDMAEAGRGLADFAAYQRRALMLAVGEETESLLASPVTPNYFSLLGVHAALGRTSVEPQSGRPQVVLGHKLWQRRFGGDSKILGATILLSGEAFQVAGVMGEDFKGLTRAIATDVWVSTDAWFTVLGRRRDQESREGQFEIVARLKPGVTAQRVAAQVDASLRGPGKHRPAPRGTPGTWLESRIALEWMGTLLLGGGLVLALTLVLFVACANVAQMRLAQADSRKRELGVRMAVGAGAGRVARQLLVETALVTAMGASLGVYLADVLMRKAAEFLSAGNGVVDYGIRLDARVLVYTLLAVTLSVLFSGLAPVRYALRFNVSEVLKCEQGTTGGGSRWSKKLLVIGQVAVSIALFGTAAMFLASLRNASAVHPGLDPRKNLYVTTVAPGLQMKRGDWCEQVCERLAALGGVRGATFARRLPLSGSGGGMTARVELPGQAPLGVPLNNVGGNYFQLLGTRVVAGRGVEPGDRWGSEPVVVLSQALAVRAFPGRNPLGEWLRVDGQPRHVVGVGEDGPSNDLHEAPEPFLWLPFRQAPSGDITLMVETAADPNALAQAIRAELKRFDPRVEIYSSGTLRKQLDEALAQDRAMATVTSGLGIFGVLLTAAGLFGVLQYTVSRRTREFGLRMALGAAPGEIQRLVFAESLRIAIWGVPLGVLLLLAAGSSIKSWLLGVTPLNPLVYVVSVAAVLALTILAAWLPAVRATRVDPMVALRTD